MTNPVVTITMNSGAEIKLELLPEIAPISVNNFISLVNQGFYNGLIFHRVIPGFMIQGGCPNGTGMGDPGYSIRGEFTSNGIPNNLSHDTGVLSMARAANPNSGGSQFFITVAPAKFLDNEYAAFGRVLSGMEEAQRIVNVPRNAMDKPYENQIMSSVTVDCFGVVYPEPEKM